MQLTTSLLCLAALTPLAVAQDTVAPTKVDETRPAVADVKTHWIAPAKTDVSLTQPAGPIAPPNPYGDLPFELSQKLDELAPAAGFEHVIDQLYWDAPGDGSLWVRGATYKARFGVDGVDYVPFLGSQAPRNYPVSFRLAGASVGGQALELTAEALTVERVGDSIEIDRGGLLVRYHIGLESIEQTFVLPSRAHTGDLVVRVEVDSELAFSDAAAGFAFSNEIGGVNYGEALVFDDRGASESLGSTFTDGTITITVPAAFMDTAAFPVTIDPVISTWSVNTSSTHAFYPDVAYDETHDRYLVVWQEEYSSSDNDVYAQLVSASGTNVTGGYIDYTTDNWRDPSVGNNNIADQFLVASEEGFHPNRIISGRTVSASSLAMNSQFTISGSFGGDKSDPDVGGDPVLAGPTYYAVVWQREYTSTDDDIHFQLIRSDATKVFSSTQYIDNTGGTHDFDPRISKSNGLAPFSTQRWNVSFGRTFSSTDHDVRGAQLTWNGTVVTPSFSLDYSGYDHLYSEPSSPLDAAEGERDWLCVYQAETSSGWNIKGTLLKGDDELVEYDLTTLEQNPAAANTQGGPTVTSDGTQFTVVYHELYGSSTTDWDVYAMTLRHDANELHLVEGHQNMAYSGFGEVWPVITSTRDGGGADGRFFATWYQRTATGDYDIEAAMHDLPDTYANVGYVSCTSNDNTTGEPADFRALGTSSAAANFLFFDVDNLPANEFGYFIMGQNSTSQTVADGVLCIGGPQIRVNQSFENSSWHGSFVKQLDLNSLPIGTVVQGGQTWLFQLWYRDGSSSNFSNAVAIPFN